MNRMLMPIVLGWTNGLWRVALLAWWFLAFGGSGSALGPVKTAIGPFSSEAQCEAWRAKLPARESLSDGCWWDGKP